MRFWEIADARNPMFFHTKSVPEPRWSTSAVRRLRDGLVCGRIMFGSWADRFRIVNGIASGAGGWVADGIPLWFATQGSVPHCKWDCKWCWWRSCRWSFEGSLARNAFLRDSRCTKPYVFPYKVRPRTSTIYPELPFLLIYGIPPYLRNSSLKFLLKLRWIFWKIPP